MKIPESFSHRGLFLSLENYHELSFAGNRDKLIQQALIIFMGKKKQILSYGDNVDKNTYDICGYDDNALTS